MYIYIGIGKVTASNNVFSPFCVLAGMKLLCSWDIRLYLPQSISSIPLVSWCLARGGFTHPTTTSSPYTSTPAALSSVGLFDRFLHYPTAVDLEPFSTYIYIESKIYSSVAYEKYYKRFTSHSATDQSKNYF